MWKLKSTKKEHIEHFIFVGEECIVGRKDSSLLISNDPSVSRKHAVLHVKHSVENLNDPSRKSSLFLRDEGSKYGTFKNGVRVNSEEELKDGDVVKFGQFESEFRVFYVTLVLTTSCLDITAKNKLRKIVYKLGGHIVSEWQPCCSHLVMSQVKVTIKALCCLVSCKSIVLPQYFEELEKSLSSSATILSASGFIPPVGEALIDKEKVSFDINPLRKSIFNGKTFYFMDEKQFKKLHLGIVLGGGKASILMDDKVDTTVLLREGSCFIEPVKDQVVTEKAKLLLREIIIALQKKSLRMIPESDIGLAVAYSSTEQFCNPEFNPGPSVLGSQRIYSQTLSEREVYVPDTEGKNSRIADSEIDNPPKRRKVEQHSSLNLTSFRDEDMNVVEIPLSAQVKQELDDIFEITSDNEDNNTTKPHEVATPLPSTLQLNAEREKNEASRMIPQESQDKRYNKCSLNKENGLNAHSNKLIPKVEPTLRQENGISSHAKDFDNFNFPMPSVKNDVLKNGRKSPKKNSSDNKSPSAPKTPVLEETEIPCNLIQIKFVDLICKKAPAPSQNTVRNSSVKNFKKFKKVYPLKAQALPRIIGIHELIPYDRDAVKIFNEDWDNPIEEKIQKPATKGEFDW